LKADDRDMYARKNNVSGASTRFVRIPNALSIGLERWMMPIDISRNASPII